MTGERLHVIAASPRRRLWLPVSSAPARSTGADGAPGSPTAADAQARALQCCLDMLLVRRWRSADGESWSGLDLRGVVFPSQPAAAARAEAALRGTLLSLVARLPPVAVCQLAGSLRREWAELTASRRRSWSRRGGDAAAEALPNGVAVLEPHNRSSTEGGPKSILKSPQPPRRQQRLSFESGTKAGARACVIADAKTAGLESDCAFGSAASPRAGLMGSMGMEEAASIIAGLPDAAGLATPASPLTNSDRETAGASPRGAPAPQGACESPSGLSSHLPAYTPPHSGAGRVPGASPLGRQPASAPSPAPGPRAWGARRGAATPPQGSPRLTPLRSRGALLLSRSTSADAGAFSLVLFQPEGERAESKRLAEERKRRGRLSSPQWNPQLSRRGRQLLHQAGGATKPAGKGLGGAGVCAVLEAAQLCSEC